MPGAGKAAGSSRPPWRPPSRSMRSSFPSGSPHPQQPARMQGWAPTSLAPARHLTSLPASESRESSPVSRPRGPRGPVQAPLHKSRTLARDPGYACWRGVGRRCASARARRPWRIGIHPAGRLGVRHMDGSRRRRTTLGRRPGDDLPRRVQHTDLPGALRCVKLRVRGARLAANGIPALPSSRNGNRGTTSMERHPGTR